MHSIYKLKGKVQHYAWGGYDFLPQLLHRENTEHKPFAEYWLGAHAGAPSTVGNGEEGLLPELIKKDPEKVLGKNVAGKYHQLPFLFKVLDVREMLSIQLHPSKKAAEKGFSEENEKGIPIDATNRNYKDDNHKPELMVALSEFWLLHGFKPKDLLLQTLNGTPEFTSLVEKFLREGYYGLFRFVMEMPQDEVNRILSPVVESAAENYRQNKLSKADENFWAARAAETYCTGGNMDRGIFSIYILNLLKLEKEEGIFQPAGVLHAYLEGQNVELMANSDNVLRGGLTNKHIDIGELMKNLVAEPVVPQVIHPSGTGAYNTPAEEFSLVHEVIRNEKEFITEGAEVLFVLQGSAYIESTGNSVWLNRGEAAFVVSGTNFRLVSEQGVEIFRACTP